MKDEEADYAEAATQIDEVDEIGKPIIVQEALGMIIGTLVRITPFEIVLGEDAVHARNMDAGLTAAMNSGTVTECHPLRNVKIERAAVRYRWVWGNGKGKRWPVPKPRA